MIRSSQTSRQKRHGLWMMVTHVLTTLLAGSALHAQTWRSTLYSENWQRPDENTSFYNDKLIQDFSYAGYKRGEQAVPTITGPVFNVTDVAYGADPSGAVDSTVAIQSAIDAAAVAGGGVVYMPTGAYKISPQGTNSYCLLINSPNIVLRGAGADNTFLTNTSIDMRAKDIIRVRPASVTTNASVSLTADLNGPTRRLPVASPSAFVVGDVVRLEWVFTDEWIAEHSQQAYWSEAGGTPGTSRILREVTAVDEAGGWIEVDIPTRYTMKVRDSARVTKVNGLLENVGVESLAIGNVENPDTNWGENDYTIVGTGAYETHSSYALEMVNVRDCWITGVESFHPAGNTSTCHILSNGISLSSSCRVTVSDCLMSRPQYGGGGGNGYMYRLINSSDCLIQNSVADFSRHGFVTSHSGTTGNVFYQCEDRETQRATGSTGSYTTNGSGSDNHMFFSHSNLWDSCVAYNSFYTASHRGTSGSTPHALTSAHGVYWNTSGSGTRYNNIVLSSQGRYGYVIGTSGSQSGASNPTTGNTAPADHLEGIGTGDLLYPSSLYLDQLSRRVSPTVTYAANGADGGTVPVDANSPYSSGAAVTVLGKGNLVRSNYTFIGWNTMPDGSGADYAVSSTFTIDNHLTFYAQWQGIGVTVNFDANGGVTPSPTSKTVSLGSSYGSLATTSRSGHGFKGWFTAASGGVEVTSATEVTTSNTHALYARWAHVGTLQYVDQIVGLRQDSAPALGYYPNTNEDLVGSTGSSATLTRKTVNLVLGYSLPTLPVGTTVDSAVFHFEITANRDTGNVDPSLNVHLLDVANPDSSGDTYFFSGPTDSSSSTSLVGSTYIDVGTTEASYADDEHDQSYTLSGASLSVLQGYYGGDHIPERSEVFFRFSLSTTADIGNLDRYRIDLATDESSIEILATDPPVDPFGDWVALGGGGVTFSGDANSDGVADGMAWLLGVATPASSARALLPTSTESSGALTLSFNMLKAPKRGASVLQLQFSNDLGVSDLWSDHTVTVPDTSSAIGGVVFVITPNGDVNAVQATVPSSAASNKGKVFARLSGIDSP